MNRNRKEELLTRWMDGELDPKELHELGDHGRGRERCLVARAGDATHASESVEAVGRFVAPCEPEGRRRHQVEADAPAGAFGGDERSAVG